MNERKKELNKQGRCCVCGMKLSEKALEPYVYCESCWELFLKAADKVKKEEMIEPRCIYCKKTSSESGRMLFLIDAPGTYYQCYPKLCPENKNMIPPNGKEIEKERGDLE